MSSFSIGKEVDYKTSRVKTVNKKERNKRNCELARILKINRVKRN